MLDYSLLYSLLQSFSKCPPLAARYFWALDLAMQNYYNSAVRYFNTFDSRIKGLMPKNWWFCFEYFPDNQIKKIKILTDKLQILSGHCFIVKINIIFLFLELHRQLKKTQAFPEMTDFLNCLRHIHYYIIYCKWFVYIILFLKTYFIEFVFLRQRIIKLIFVHKFSHKFVIYCSKKILNIICNVYPAFECLLRLLRYPVLY